MTPDFYDSSERRSVWLKGQKLEESQRYTLFIPRIGEHNLLVRLLVVVDLVVPEDGLIAAVLATSFSLVSIRSGTGSKAYLVTVTPEVVLGTDVLVGVLGLLGLRGLVGLVLPVLEPQAVGVDTTEDDGGDDDAVVRNTRSESCFAVSFLNCSGMVSLSQFVRRGHNRSGDSEDAY